MLQNEMWSLNQNIKRTLRSKKSNLCTPRALKINSKELYPTLYGLLVKELEELNSLRLPIDIPNTYSVPRACALGC